MAQNRRRIVRINFEVDFIQQFSTFFLFLFFSMARLFTQYFQSTLFNKEFDNVMVDMLKTYPKYSEQEIDEIN